MEELYPVNMTISELNIIHNIIGAVISRGKYEKGAWDGNTTKEVDDLVEKVRIILEDAYAEINKYE
jgi:hypothetical protein